MKHRSIQRADSGSLLADNALADNTGLLRILLLGGDSETVELLQSALWIWPHRISCSTAVDDALSMCEHLCPAAIVVPVRGGADRLTSRIARLRGTLPDLPIIAIAGQESLKHSADFIAAGASAVIGTDELYGSRFHDLLERLRDAQQARVPQLAPPAIRLETPWRCSPIIGALICDVDGHIIDANDRLAEWLEYESGEALRERHLWRDLLDSSVDWTSWKTVAGDVYAMHNDAVCMRSVNGQLRWMQVQVFAATQSPTHLQIAFVDQTELAQLSGTRHLTDEPAPELPAARQHV